MSLPIAAVGPLKVETKPILMLSAESAGCASARTAAPASQNAFFIFTPLLIILIFRQPKRPLFAARTPPPKPDIHYVICARNPLLAASTNRKPALRTFGSYPRGLHHSSPDTRMAR